MHATASHSSSLRTARLWGILGVIGFAACMEPLHLAPSGAASGAGGGGGATSSGSTSSGCHSSPDCAYPTPVCDPASGTCVGCLSTASDCTFMPGSVCAEGQCSCPTLASAPLTTCTGASPGCFDTQTSPDHCGTCDNACDSGSCAGGVCVAGDEDAGDGGHDDAGDAGHDGGIHDGGSDGSVPCAPTCNMALLNGGGVCAGAAGSADFKTLASCAGCSSPILFCASVCPTLCLDQVVDAACRSCLMFNCQLQLSLCQSH